MVFNLFQSLFHNSNQMVSIVGLLWTVDYLNGKILLSIMQFCFLKCCGCILWLSSHCLQLYSVIVPFVWMFVVFVCVSGVQDGPFLSLWWLCSTFVCILLHSLHSIFNIDGVWWVCTLKTMNTLHCPTPWYCHRNLH